MHGSLNSSARSRRQIQRKNASVALLLSALLTLGTASRLACAAAPTVGGDILAHPVAVAPFQLHDAADGTVFTQANLQQRWTLLLFGFASCPGICPANLSQMSQAYRKLKQAEPKAPLPQMVFVSVDPKRDTPERLHAFTSAIDPHIVAVTGADRQLRGLERDFKTSHSYGPVAANGFYPVNHSAFMYLIDPHGQWVATLQPPFHIDALEKDYAAMVEYEAKHS